MFLRIKFLVRNNLPLFLLFAIFLQFNISSASAGISGTQDLSFIYYHVDGNIDNSFYPQNDFDYLYEGTIDFTTLFLKNEGFGHIVYRSTDDLLVDNQDLSLEEFYMGLRGDNFEFLGGDFYSNFSDYSLSNALKGFKLTTGQDDDLHMKFVAGIDTTKWEDLLWEERHGDSATRKYVWGWQIGNKFFDKRLSLNFNYGASLDDRAYLSDSSTTKFINVTSLDGTCIINDMIDSYFEAGYSFTDNDKDSDDSDLSKTDTAYRIGFNLDTKPYTANVESSRLGSNYNTTGGFSAADLETWKFDGLWYLPKNIRFSHYLTVDRDNLDKHKSTTTRQINPGTKLSLTLPWDIAWELGFDLRKRDTTDYATDEKTYTYSTNFAKDFKIVYGNLGYTKTIISDRIDPTQERNIDTASLGLDGNFMIKDVKISWNFSEDLNHEHYKDINEADLTLNHSIGLQLDFPSTLSFRAKAILSDNNYYINSTDSNTIKYSFSVTRDLAENLRFALNYEHNGYGYSESNNNYSETILSGSLNYKF